MTLARLLREDGESVEARQCVAGVYDRFTEGFETVDLRAARGLLDELHP